MFGPLSINIFGIFALLAVVVFIALTSVDVRRSRIVGFEDHLSNFFWIVMFGLLGARALNVACDWTYFSKHPEKIVQIWDGGLSLTGAIISVIFVGWVRARILGINFFRYADLLCTYAPVCQAVARLGCLFAGCCFGEPLLKGANIFGVIYTNPASLAPVGVVMHPAQLYSIAMSLLIFGVLFLVSRVELLARGSIFFGYLALEGLARSWVDFYRGQRQVVDLELWIGTLGRHMTVSQILAFFISIFGLIGFLAVNFSSGSASQSLQRDEKN